MILTKTSIYLFSFVLAYYLKRHNLLIGWDDLSFILFYLGSFMFSSALTGNFKRERSGDTFATACVTLKTFILNLAILTVLISLLEIITVSRTIIFGSLIVGLELEILYEYIQLRKQNKKFVFNKPEFALSFFLIDLFIYSLVLLPAYYFIYNPTYEKNELVTVLLFYLFWFTLGLANKLFIKVPDGYHFWKIVWIRIKNGVILFTAVSSYIFLIDLDQSLKLMILKFLTFYFTLSGLVVLLIYIYKRGPKTDEIRTEVFTATELKEKKVLNASDTVKQKGIYTYCYNFYEDGQLIDKLKNVYLKKFESLFKFIEEYINLKSFDPARSIIIRSADIYNVDVLPENTVELYMNLHIINDMRYLDRYFFLVNKCLQKRGIFIGCYEPTTLRYKSFIEDYPHYLSKIFYFFDFLWRRVTPKLPILQNIYFGVTKGHNRALSMAETMGRIYHCGFEIIALHEVDNLQYFIANKVCEVECDSSPSYGLFFKMRRKGKNGKDIFVYKFRTMHPYSEYIQKYLFDLYGLKEGGKIEHDIRITTWGKFLRKLWIDELPMLINWIKGDLKLLGVRPLSNHYFNLYRKSLREKRIKYKPGLVPPFYADLPKTFEEIMDSEERYLDSYEKHPFLTDFRYLYKAFVNIVFRSARSS